MTAPDHHHEPDQEGGEVLEHPGRYPRTDLGNVKRFLDRHRDDVRYCPHLTRWFIWDGHRWESDERMRAEQLVVETILDMHRAALQLPDATTGKDAQLKYALSSQRAGKLRAVLEWGRAGDGIPVKPTDLDQGRFLLNVRNGTLELSGTPTLRGHDRADLITKIAPVAYDPAAKCPRWLRFLDEVFLADQELIHFMQRAAGYSLTGDTSHHCGFLLDGDGANGKSTFVETLLHLAGEYGQETPENMLLQRKYDGIPNDIARLRGVRFASASEIPKGARLNEPRIKQLVAGDTVSARFMRGEFFDFKPDLKLWIDTNYKPTVHGQDEGIWRRIRVIPFRNHFPEDQRDLGLGDYLKEHELPGILNWALDGLRDLNYGDTLDPPKAVRDATSQYRIDEDVIGRFIADATKRDPDGSTPIGELYHSYTTWCTQNGERPEKTNAFARELTRAGFEGSPSGQRRRRGIRLLTDEDLFDQQQEQRDDKHEGDVK